MDSFFDTLKNMGPARLAVMALTLLGLVVFFIFIMARSSTPNMTLLYSGLSTSDSTEIAAKLDNTRVNYRLSDDGTQISVPHKDVGRARMLLAQEGLPRQGSMGYELFDQKQSFGETNFRQNINQLRALEGELSRTVGTLAQIRTARVHLVLPQRELFSRDTRPASASVFVSLRGNDNLGTEQIQAIQHLVAAAVPQLKAAHVAIIDQSGNLLARGEEGDSQSATARSSEDLRQKYEQRVTRSVEDLVGRIVGFGRVRANVTAELNFDIVSRNSETFNPEGQVVRSTQSVTDESQDASSSTGAPVSVETNLPGLPGGAGGNAQAGNRSNRTEEVTNFEISKTVESVVRAAGDVKRLSIAVVVDGRYETDANAAKPEDAPKDWTAPKVYVPRSDEELDKIATLVKSAVGFDASRGDTVEVLNMAFAETDFFDGPVDDGSIMGFARADLLGLAETLALSLVAVLAILAVFRPLISHFAAAAKTAATSGAHADDLPPLLATQGAQAQLAGPQGMLPGAAGGMGGPTAGELDSMIDMTSVEGKVKASSVQKISELVTSHPNETVSVIRQWMSQES